MYNTKATYSLDGHAYELTFDSGWLSISEAAGLLGVHPSTVRLWSDEDSLRSAHELTQMARQIIKSAK